MSSTLRFQKTDPFFEKNQQNIQTFKESDSTVFENALYLQEGLDSSTFESKRTIEVNNINFRNKKTAVTTINKWASTATHGKIDNLVSETDITDDTALILLNAIYFNAKWQTEFSDEDTIASPFNTEDGSQTDVPMMVMSEYFMFHKSKMFKLLELPYEPEIIGGKTQNYVMWILLPTGKHTLSKVVNKLSFTELIRISKKMSERKVDIELPKFEMHYEVDVKRVLSSLNMSSFFEMNALNITGNGDDKVDKVVQKAFIKVYEGGTEAAAASFMSSELFPIFFIYI
jgi:serpin B